MAEESSNVFNPGDIEYYMAGYIRQRRAEFAGKTCVDAPAGQGVTSRVLLDVGADVAAFDIFPQYYKVEGAQCEYADLTRHIPLPDNHADWFICQEGFEHISDHNAVFAEINRVLKPGGRLLITVPNYSNLKSKLSYLFFESECYGRDMPPNELDTVWHADGGDGELYFGHAFLCGIQKLMFLGRMNGFSLRENHPTKVNKNSIFFFPFFYPFIALTSLRTYFYASGKKKKAGNTSHQSLYRELLKRNLQPRTLLCKNLFLEFEKTASRETARERIAQGKEASPWETVSTAQRDY